MQRLNGSFKGRGRNYWTLLTCPVDGAPLRSEGGIVRCGGSPSHTYPVEDGILRLFAPDQQMAFEAASAAHEAESARRGWSSPDEGAFKSLPQTGLGGYPEGYWAQQADATALLWRFLEVIRRQDGRPPVGPMGEAAVIGAGMGWLAYGLNVAGFATIALDVYAGPRYGLGVFPIAHYLRVQADPLHPPLARGSFDLLVYQDGLARSDDESDHRAALESAMRALRPGGWLAVIDALSPEHADHDSVRGLVEAAGLHLMAAPRRQGLQGRLIEWGGRLVGAGTAPPVIMAQKPQA